MKVKRITGKEVKDAVEWLWKNKFGCYHFAVFTDEYGTEFDIVIGWSDYDDGPCADNEFYYCDEGYRIAWKIGVQSPLNGMQTDFDIDFNYPEDKDGFLIGCRCPIVRLESDDGFENEAKRMNEEAERILGKLKLI